MVSMTIASFVLLGVFSTFLFIGRTSVRLSQYSEMESQARATFEAFGLDCRTATNAAWSNANTLTLTNTGISIVYRYDATAGTFSRTASGTTRTIARNISSFSFKAFDINLNELNVASSATTIGPATKMIQVTMDLSRQATTTTAATQRVVSARFVLRNKKVS